MIDIYESRGFSGIEQQLEKYGNVATVTEGVSMRPLFKTRRDMVILEKPKALPVKYDVVLYKVKEKYVMHRIIGVDAKKSVYIIRGDNTYRKEYVPFECIIAKLVAFNRKGKYKTTDAAGYKFYSRFWNFLYPVRSLLRMPKAAARKLYRLIKVKRRDKK